MIKDIIVHLDGSPADEERLQHAEAVASLSQAHLTGLFTNPLPDFATLVPMDGGAVAASVLADLEDDARRQGDIVRQRLAERFHRLGVSNEIRRVDGVPGHLPELAAAEARWADLFVASRPYGGNGGSEWDGLFETVLFDGGRSVLAVPHGRSPADAIRRVLVCWRDTRESARAVAEAAPLIARSSRVVVLVIDGEMSRTGEKTAPAADIARHLDRLGAPVEIVSVDSQGRAVADVILEQAHRMSADLIVMGAYGHSRAREWMMGGATRDMLSNSDVPILMAH